MKSLVFFPSRVAIWKLEGTSRVRSVARLPRKRAKFNVCNTTVDRAGYSSRPSSSTRQFEAIVEEPSGDNWKSPLARDGMLPPVVALGKFDAMHVGHRALAEAAAALGGHPWLISFSGMAEVLGWEARLPIIPISEKNSVLKSWGPFCGGTVPCMRYLPFKEIRSMSPEEFVKLLAKELGAIGVVAGVNYRFGYKAAGDAKALEELGAKYGLKVAIIDLVTPHGEPMVEKVSTSEVRSALKQGDLPRVQRYLDRRYRLVADLAPHSIINTSNSKTLQIPTSALMNQPPTPGTYLSEVRIYELDMYGSTRSSNEPLWGPQSSNVVLSDNEIEIPNMDPQVVSKLSIMRNLRVILDF